MERLQKTYHFSIVATITMLSFLAILSNNATVKAACSTTDTGRGVATANVSVATSGTYRVWSRIKAADSTNNSYILEVDNATCNIIVGDKGALSANTWTWVDYQQGSTNAKTNLTLTAGTHSIKMIGREDDVQVDRIILTADTACVPSGNGSNCIVAADTTAPTTSITSPANNASVSGATIIRANATDAVGVKRVDFLVDGVTRSTDASSDYSFSLDTTQLTDGGHSLVTKAYDAADNVGTSTAVNITVANGKPDLVITQINWSPTSPATSNSVTFSATIKNQGTVATTLGVNHGVRFDVDSQIGVTWSGGNTSTSLAPNASKTFTANASPTAGVATWTAISGTHSIKATIDDLGVIAESNETNNSLAANLSVSSSDTTAPNVSITAPNNNGTVSKAYTITTNATDTGGSGISRIEFYVNNVLIGTDTTAPYTFNWITTAVTNGSFSLTARAIDGAGNSRTSSPVTALVNNVEPVDKPGDVTGDGKIDVFDLSIIATNFNMSGRARQQGDLNGDGVVNVFDLSIAATNWGK